jgi:biopolymer transport protein ExbB
MLNLILLQSTIDSVATAVPVVKPVESINYFKLLLNGGFVIYPIMLLLLLSLYYIVERWLYITSATKIDPGFVAGLKVNLQKGDIKSAAIYSKSNTKPIARILEKGISRVGRPIDVIESAMEIQSNLEVSKMEKNMGFLGLIAGVAPTLGFIGTISGIIRIFFDIAQTNDISIGVIANGLYEKMISSFAGLIVGVIAYAGYHGLNMLIDKFSINLQSTIMDFFDTLNEPTR